jgi:hypothetical protein
MDGFMDWALMVALAFGAAFAVWILDACVILARGNQFLGGALFMLLMLGLPIVAVIWGFATGALPYRP